MPTSELQVSENRFKISADASFLMDDNYSLESVKMYENAGFDSVWFADHFLPWQHSFKYSPSVWPLLGVAAERSRSIPIGIDVTSPIGGRYHPAIIAQATATLSLMFPGRIYLGVGTGEALNDGRFMTEWPDWKERMDRLIEGISLIRKLWESPDYFDFQGKYFNMRKIFLYAKPKINVPIYFSAIGEKAAIYAGRYGDHLLTDNSPKKCRDKIFPKFEEGAKKANKDPSRMERAVLVLGGVGNPKQIIAKLRKLIIGGEFLENIDALDPREIDRHAQEVSDEMILNTCYVSETISELIELFDQYKSSGANHIIYTDFSSDPFATAKLFSEKIIPHFRRSLNNA